jgi:hypothetical protein
MVVVELKLARGMILGLRVDWIKHVLNPARDEKKREFNFLEHIFRLKINLEKCR